MENIYILRFLQHRKYRNKERITAHREGVWETEREIGMKPPLALGTWLRPLGQAGRRFPFVLVKTTWLLLIFAPLPVSDWWVKTSLYWYCYNSWCEGHWTANCHHQAVPHTIWSHFTAITPLCGFNWMSRIITNPTQTCLSLSPQLSHSTLSILVSGQSPRLHFTSDVWLQPSHVTCERAEQ